MTLDVARAPTFLKARSTHYSQSGLRQISTFGTTLLVGTLCLFVLLQTHSIWQSPTLIADRWKQVFYPLARLFPVEWVRPVKTSSIALVNSGLYLLLIAGLFAVYVFAIKRALRPGVFGAVDGRAALRRIVWITALVLLVLLVVPGDFSTDLFSYVWYGRIYAVFGESPLTHVPADYTWADGGRWLQWVYWKETPSVYGPVWIALAGAIAKVAQLLGGDIVYHVLGHKLLASAAHLINTLLVWKVAGMILERWSVQATEGKDAPTGWKTGAQVAATLAYAWNPLLLIEFGASAHNDVLMLTGILAMLWLHLAGRWRMALVALALASLVKLIALLFLPGYLWLLFWEAAPSAAGARVIAALPARLSRVAQALLIFGGTWVVTYIPFWEGPATLTPLLSGPATEYFINSLGFVLRFRLPEGISSLAAAFDWQPAEFWRTQAVGWRLDWPARWGPLLITGAVAATQTWHARSFRGMLAAWGWTVFAYLTVGSVWFWPWYVSWLIVVAVLVGPGRLFKATVILSATSVALYGMYWTGNALFRELAGWRPLAIMLPPLVYVLASYWLARRRVAVVRTRTRAAKRGVHVPEPARAVPVPLIPVPAVGMIEANRSRDIGFGHPELHGRVVTSEHGDGQ
jgi:hypothetical protein